MDISLVRETTNSLPLANEQAVRSFQFKLFFGLIQISLCKEYLEVWEMLWEPACHREEVWICVLGDSGLPWDISQPRWHRGVRFPILTLLQLWCCLLKGFMQSAFEHSGFHLRSDAANIQVDTTAESSPHPPVWSSFSFSCQWRCRARGSWRSLLVSMVCDGMTFAFSRSGTY